ncbi:1-acyl-sn-glycerol-3-phosphate acyltransferase [Reichenbachiella agarivorans]|uniref:Glycerol-3-phosphate acyltransferase n=1 Tax=Reichenbachiella agarivorans TaxID=2979464 RepID=A0ABY6CT11_9BACT|nr:1-acyl-sn-glycerol-3-phosphate acyltransferase [Reichenbachiella agarivorans]UXP32518.1 1-acyl-sn-glycerol-3-phosphate acyltransferase [Reichenbachiella agarivorans]
MKPLIRKRRTKTKYKPILKNANTWPVMQMAKKRKEFVQLVVEESYDNLLNLKRGKSLKEELEMTIFREKQRVKTNPWKVDPVDDYSFWEKMSEDLAQVENLKEADKDIALKNIMVKIVERYSNEIAGHFNPSHYNVTRTLVTIGFGRLLNAVRVKGPWSVFSNQLDLDDKIHITGKVDELRKLAKMGTVVMVPTHYSNLDSVLIGWVIQFLGLPPFIYGAGLNLFNLKIFSYFMNSVGAYKVDRRKKNALYLETLKAYSTIAIREGCHSLFFPGGTRSRSGKIEKVLKLGLLGTAIEAQRQVFQSEDSDQNKVFIVPVAINYHFVLEAPSLINDYLKRKGQQRYYEENDEFTTSYKISKFLVKFFTKGSDISVSIGDALDVLGNNVDSKGNSLDKNGQIIDIKDYFKSNGEITENHQREQEYNRILGKKIVEEFHKHSRVFSSHMVAYVGFRMLGRINKHLDLYGLLRLQDDDLIINYDAFKAQFIVILEALKELNAQKQVGMADHLFSLTVDEIIDHGLKNLGMYHAMLPMVKTKKGDIEVQNMNLLYFYHNKLIGYDLEKYF